MGLKTLAALRSKERGERQGGRSGLSICPAGFGQGWPWVIRLGGVDAEEEAGGSGGTWRVKASPVALFPVMDAADASPGIPPLFPVTACYPAPE